MTTDVPWVAGDLPDALGTGCACGAFPGQWCVNLSVGSVHTSRLLAAQRLRHQVPAGALTETLLVENKRLTDECIRRNQLLNHYRDELEDQESIRLKLRRRYYEAKGAFFAFGTHTATCPKLVFASQEKACTCGFDVAHDSMQPNDPSIEGPRGALVVERIARWIEREKPASGPELVQAIRDGKFR